MKNNPKNLNEYIFWAIIVALIILSFFIVRPFLIPLISAFILAYLSLPLYNKLKKSIPKFLSAIICVILVMVIIILPLGTIATGITAQTSSALSQGNLKSLLQDFSKAPIIKSLNLDLSNLTENFLELTSSLIKSALSHLPSIIISLIIILFGMYYILISWDTLSLKLKEYLPFNNKKEIAKEISQITNTLVYGTIFIAMIEFIVSTLGFYLSGVPSFLLLSAIIFFFAFIPGLGPTIVWVPMALYYLITQNYFALAGVIITGLILSNYVDIILRAKVLGDRVKLNPLLMIIGILGGISIFGIFGFIIGPLILIYTIKLIEEAVKGN